ncbi:hypothetical protein [Nocardioides lacusdianchii]|uniref:hypothetical protein n=1 Tax=Nocardioides lacusdianchii TaxID=2783664 RepID=UPI001CCC4F60|nr:hypothetical protein [Nocardioides lacusdianchii]
MSVLSVDVGEPGHDVAMTSDGEPHTDRHQLDTVKILLIAVVGVLLTIAIAYATWWHSDLSVSEFPSWLEAWATVAAVGAAIVGGFYAARAFSLERQRDWRRDEDNRIAQASLVAAW